MNCLHPATPMILIVVDATSRSFTVVISTSVQFTLIVLFKLIFMGLISNLDTRGNIP